MRAILLAAGMGTRLRPLTESTPKSLVKVNGKPMIERQIEFLKERGINDIVILTGYLKEKFDYLAEKYNVKLVNNDKYDIYNNIYTMYIVKDYLSDAYVIEADVYLCRNFLAENLTTSTYFTGKRKNFKNEWKLYFDVNGKVTDIKVESGDGFIMSGVSYWTQKDGDFIKDKLSKVIEAGNFNKLYWDDIVKENLKGLDIHVNEISGDDWFEIDCLEDLNSLNDFLMSNEGLQ